MKMKLPPIDTCPLELSAEQLNETGDDKQNVQHLCSFRNAVSAPPFSTEPVHNKGAR
jgi:hypothetical protein